MARIERPISMALWGKDHWSTLLYVETRVVDFSGVLDRRSMRCKPTRTTLAHDGSKMDYSTRLKHGVNVAGHDDWDCLSDMHAAGLLTLDTKTLTVRLTDLGWTVAHQLRRHRAEGRNDRDFAPQVAESADPIAHLREPPATACINCGEKNDGGYVADGVGCEGAVGPFCSQCWQFLHEQLQTNLREHGGGSD